MKRESGLEVMAGRLLTIEEAAGILRVKRQTLYNWLSLGPSTGQDLRKSLCGCTSG